MNVFEDYCKRNLGSGEVIANVSTIYATEDELRYGCTLRINSVNEGTIMRTITGTREFLSRFREGYFNSKK